MRRFILAACAFVPVTLLGCSLFNGKDGFLDRAAAKDTEQSLMIKKCTQDVYDLYCKRDRSSPDCRRFCG